MSAERVSRQIEDLNTQARHAMSARRYLHVLGVTHTATALASLHGLDPILASQAGLLHDISKDLPSDQIATEMASLGRPLGPGDRPYPRTWHGLHAAAIGPMRFGITNNDLLRAVALHTTGDAEMHPLALVLFVADFCEPNRKIAEAPEVLALAKQDLAAGFRLALDLKTRHMLAKPAFELHPRTWRAIQHWLPERAVQIPPPPHSIQTSQPAHIGGNA